MTLSSNSASLGNLFNNAKACYDSIVHTFTCLALLRLGIPIGPITVMFGTIQLLHHFIHMAFGDSDIFFTGTQAETPIQGVGQGNGAGPQIWAVVSSPIFDMVCKMEYGTTIQSLRTSKIIKFVGFGFVDDVNLVVTTNVNQDELQDTLHQLQKTLDLWEHGLCTSGGALSAKKSHWTFIDFKWSGGNWCYKTRDELPGVLYMNDVTGKRLPLE